jgi:hypothetical protein
MSDFGGLDEGHWVIESKSIPFQSGVLCTSYGGSSNHGDCWRVRRVGTNCFGLFHPNEPDVKPLHVLPHFQLKDGLPCFNSGQLQILRTQEAIVARKMEERRAENARLAKEAEEKAEEAETNRIAWEAGKKRLAAEQAEKKRLAEEDIEKGGRDLSPENRVKLRMSIMVSSSRLLMIENS